MSKLSHDMTKEDVKQLYELIPKCETCKMKTNCSENILHIHGYYGLDFCSEHSDFDEVRDE